MIASISGTLCYAGTDRVVIEAGGIGYRLFVSAKTAAAMPPRGEQAFLFTYLQVSDTSVTLYGFLSEEEKTIFESLIVVRGIGPKGALAALAVLTPAELVTAIVNEDTATLTSIPGVGKKTASRIVVELKEALGDTIAAWPDLLEAAQGGVDSAPTDSAAAESAHETLRSMGFTDTEITLALAGAPTEGDEVALIQYALKRLGSG